MPNKPPPAWLAALPSLFAIGAKIGGAPTVGTAAIQGAEQGKLRQQQTEQLDIQNSQRQQALDLQTQTHQAQILARQEAMEQRRQQAIKSSIDDLRAQKFPTRKDYEASIGAHEQMLGQFYGVRPNTLRTLVPYNGPTAETRAYDAMEQITKQKNWQDIITSNGMIQFDRDDDGIPENVPVGELITLGKFPIAKDPQTGAPILPPKEVKPENVQEFDVAYEGVLGEWKAEGKNIEDPAVKGKAATEARKRISAASKQGNASVQVVMPERPMTRYQRFQAQRGLRDDATKAVAPAKELARQVNVMREGLAEAQRTGNLGPGTQAVINSFNRIMEPGSVTREAEYLRSSAGQSLMEALRGQVTRLSSGGTGVTIKTLEDTVALAEKIAASAADYADEPLRMIREQATDYGMPADDIIPAASSYRLKQRGQVSPKNFSIVAPNGKTYTFPSQEQLDAFKRASGIK